MMLSVVEWPAFSCNEKDPPSSKIPPTCIESAALSEFWIVPFPSSWIADDPYLLTMKPWEAGGFTGDQRDPPEPEYQFAEPNHRGSKPVLPTFISLEVPSTATLLLKELDPEDTTENRAVAVVPASVMAPLPRACALLTFTAVPFPCPLMVIPPEKVLLPLNVTVTDSTVNPPEPDTGPASVRLPEGEIGAGIVVMSTDFARINGALSIVCAPNDSSRIKGFAPSN